MKISWNHLQSFFAEKLDKNLVLERLTMSGLEVEDDTSIVPEFSGIVVGEVVECEKHPDADKLSLCKIDAGTGELLQIICGAPNVKKGVKAPCAKVGAVLPGNFKISERKMRGIVSYGMMCGGSEIGLDDGVDGLLLLPSDAPVGVDIRDYLDLDDNIVEFKITPNRGDCLSYLGLVREVVALTNYKAKDFSVSPDYLLTKSSEFKLDVTTPDKCQHYVGLEVKNLRNDLVTPTWLIRILERSGIRSISPVVDITNYVMLTLGQPMHAFDSSQLNGGIGVRMAKDGEILKLLDGKNAELKSNSLVIVNADNAPIALAGVMGGFDSGVINTTTDIILESAFFDPSIVQGKTKQYGVNSDSAFRFERGVDDNLQHDAINLAAKLVLEICGGVIGEYVHFSAKTKKEKQIKLTFNEINRFVGEQLSHNLIMDILSKLGCELSIDGDVIIVVPPTYRFDLNIKNDIIEEVIRVYGYDRVVAKMPELEHSFDYLDKHQDRTILFKNLMLGYGFNEIVSYAFIEDKYASIFKMSKNIVKLQNPIAGLNVMRTSLLPGLVKTLQSNVNRGHDCVKLFELARVFHGEAPTQQPLYFSGLIYGKMSPLNWSDKPRLVDFYDLKQVVDSILTNVASKVEYVVKDIPDMYHPGRSAKLLVDGVHCGYIGQLHPEYTDYLDLDILPYVFELNLDVLGYEHKSGLVMPSKYQKVSRDLSFIIMKSVEVGNIVDGVRDLNISDLTKISVFDVFSGANIEDGYKSVAINFMFQGDHTLSDDEVNGSMEQIKALVSSKFGANLR